MGYARPKSLAGANPKPCALSLSLSLSLSYHALCERTDMPKSLSCESKSLTGDSRMASQRTKNARNGLLKTEEQLQQIRHIRDFHYALYFDTNLWPFVTCRQQLQACSLQIMQLLARARACTILPHAYHADDTRTVSFDKEHPPLAISQATCVEA